jgi:hypothetical protein
VASGAKNDWDIDLNNVVSTDLTIDMGVGDCDLVLGDVNLTDFTIDSGVGNVDIDLAGDHMGNMTVGIELGTGSASLRVPSGDWFNNAVYGTSEYTITITIDIGVGDLTVELVD